MALKAASAYSHTMPDDCWEPMMPSDKELSQYLNKVESERKAKVEQLLSLGKKEQKEHVGYMVARYVYYNREYPVELPLDWFADQLQEMDRALLEELFIHAQTIFALYKNTRMAFEHVDVRAFVKATLDDEWCW